MEEQHINYGRIISQHTEEYSNNNIYILMHLQRKQQHINNASLLPTHRNRTPVAFAPPNLHSSSAIFCSREREYPREEDTARSDSYERLRRTHPIVLRKESPRRCRTCHHHPEDHRSHTEHSTGPHQRDFGL